MENKTHIITNNWQQYPNHHFCKQMPDTLMLLVNREVGGVAVKDTIISGGRSYRVEQVKKAKRVVPELVLEGTNPHIRRSTMHYELIISEDVGIDA